ncbi:hypothetical protein QU24_18550 [Pantoea rodasii]|uniref:DUF2570 domain-containing protein n=1 Tax=Pantoea rodasii TaxID=1076549 RepID=A0A0B1R0I9_9GAMM|nr:DUF2570 domain-containing protein [Pantoea rodasii]KHJ66593.1 hypothetical protein QU24_18550 [Pantoea rodasii]
MVPVTSRFNLTLLMALMLVTSIVALGITVTVQHVSIRHLTHSNQQLLSEKKSAEAIARNFIKTTLLIKDLARATQHDNQRQREESERRVVVIRKLVKSNDCAAQPVPPDAAEQLRAHRNPVR